LRIRDRFLLIRNRYSRGSTNSFVKNLKYK
jgi:hypothetical protein